MSTEDPPFSAATVLDKPLHQFTEDDISQLTREDCRHFLKQKGMRRPSWNKAQAIQQVIMLKALLEPSPSDDGGQKLYIASRRQQTPATRVQKGTSADTEISLSAEESVPGHRNDTEKSGLLGDNDSAPPRRANITIVSDSGYGADVPFIAVSLPFLSMLILLVTLMVLLMSSPPVQPMLLILCSWPTPWFR